MRLSNLRVKAALTVVAAMGIGWTVPVSAGTIHACVTKLGGIMRIVASPAACVIGESPLSWNTVGPEGPAGPTGPAGPPGAGSGPNARVMDSTGQEVGALEGVTDQQFPVVLFKVQGNAVPLIVGRNRIVAEGSRGLFFSSPDCTGQPYIHAATRNPIPQYLNGDDSDALPFVHAAVIGPNGTLYINATDAPSPVPVQSLYRTPTGCESYGFSPQPAVPANAVGDLYPLFPPPYTITPGELPEFP